MVSAGSDDRRDHCLAVAEKARPWPRLWHSFILYLVGLFGDSYYGIAERVPFLQSFYASVFTVSDYTRNGLFFAPVFLVLGAMIAPRQRGACSQRRALRGWQLRFFLCWQKRFSFTPAGSKARQHVPYAPALRGSPFSEPATHQWQNAQRAAGHLYAHLFSPSHDDHTRSRLAKPRASNVADS